MKRLLWVSGLVLFIGVPALAHDMYYAPQVTGERERKNMRHFLFVKNLTGDMKAVYDEYGYTPHRVRLNEYGQIRQRWTYYEQGLMFEFDQCGALVDSGTVPREARREWAYQRDVRGYDENVPCDE
jgi:hypothetical protein